MAEVVTIRDSGSVETKKNWPKFWVRESVIDATSVDNYSEFRVPEAFREWNVEILLTGRTSGSSALRLQYSMDGGTTWTTVVDTTSLSADGGIYFPDRIGIVTAAGTPDWPGTLANGFPLLRWRCSQLMPTGTWTATVKAW